MRAVAALLALAFGSFSFVTAETLPIGLLTLIADDLDRSLSSIGLLVTGYAVVVVIFSVPLTHATRALPRRTLLAGLLAVFAAATLVSAVAPNYATLFGARLVTALSQGLFWSVVNAAAASLFPREVRGRTLAVVSAGGVLGPVLGVPAGTWLGQQAGWRAAFVAMTVVTLLLCLAVIVLLPRDPGAGSSDASRGVTPDRTAYRLALLVTALAITGHFTMFTYVTAFLLDVSGWRASALGPLLFASGAAGILGVAAVAAVVDRAPRLAGTVAVVLLTVAPLGMAAFGTARWAAIGFAAVGSVGLSAYAPTAANRIMLVAPGSTDLAGAGLSVAFNVGIAGGSLVGGALVASVGVGGVPLVGGLIAAAALTIMIVESVVRYSNRSTPPTHRIGRSGASV